MSGPEGARTALADDLPRILELATEARDGLVDQRGGPTQLLATATPGGVEEALRQAQDDADRLVLVGTFADAPVGYALVTSRIMDGGDRIGVIDELYVEPEARRVGVGAALLHAVLEWCGSRGCVGVDAVALPGDRATKNFFEGFGLVARAIIAHRALPPEGTGAG